MAINPWVAVDIDTVPAKRARELRDAWEDFVEGEPDRSAAGAGTPTVRSPIADSWQRSRDAGVDPTGRQAAPSVADPSDTRARWAAHPLHEAQDIIEQCLAQTAGESDHLMVLSDADGTLLYVRGSAHMRNRAADEMNFREGSLWSESGAGTNAVGTALAVDHAVQVFAAEHFTESVQRWTCSCAPVHDPDDDSVIGLIDLTGDFTTVHPHSLSVVIATARAAEVLLRMRRLERDDALRARYGDLLDQGAVRKALATASGRIIVGSPAHWPRPARLELPHGGGELLLPSGVRAIAEPVGEDAWVLTRLDGGRHARPAPEPAADRPVLELRLLGPGPPTAAVDGRPVPLRRRHAELLVALLARPAGANAEQLCADLHGDGGHPGSIRVEMSRLRKLLPGCLDADRYRLRADVHADIDRVRALLRAGDVRGAAEAYPGALLPRSDAPRVVAERDELEGWLRTAVFGADDAEALWAWVQTPSGTDDRLAWSRLVGDLRFEDARRSLAAQRLRALRAEL
jgi:hypothetical protein